MILRRILPAGVLLATLGAAALTGCGTKSDEPTAAASSTVAAPVTVTDAWVKANKAGMTGVFATLTNNTDAPVNLVSGNSPVAEKVELHEVVGPAGSTTMRPKAGGIVIPAHGTYKLQPGGDHIMLMGLSGAVQPGTEVAITLILKDGRTVAFKAVGKEFAGGKENYQPSMPSMPSHG